MGAIIRQRKDTETAGPSLLAYDRYGQGLSDRDPLDEEGGTDGAGGRDGRGHDVKDAVVDLRQLIRQVWADGDEEPRVVLVANSIGCAITR